MQRLFAKKAQIKYAAKPVIVSKQGSSERSKGERSEAKRAVFERTCGGSERSERKEQGSPKLRSFSDKELKMQIYNTMTRKKEELIPIEEGTVKIYCCGPTVYNLIHIVGGFGERDKGVLC